MGSGHGMVSTFYSHFSGRAGEQPNDMLHDLQIETFQVARPVFAGTEHDCFLWADVLQSDFSQDSRPPGSDPR